MKPFIALFLMLGLVATAFAQHLSSLQSISGTVLDKKSGTALINATLLLHKEKGSLLKRSYTDEKGHFVFDMVRPGKYTLVITYIGYQRITRIFEVSSEHQELNVTMEKIGVDLSEVNVLAFKPLVTVTNDTVSYDATQIKTVENASIKKLFEKIPGLYVDDQGNYYYRGQLVKDLKIDGRAAFQKSAGASGDPKQVEDLIRADLIDKVEISDKKEINGTSNRSGEKSINLVLKKDAYNKINGTAVAGMGTSAVYNVFANINKFEPSKQFMGVVRSNNCNVYGNLNPMPALMTMPGRATVNVVDANISTNLNDKLKVNAFMTFSGQNAEVISNTNRENILKDSTYTYNSLDKTRKQDRVYMANMFIDYNFNPANVVSIGISLNKRTFDNSSSSNFSTLAKDTINSGIVNNTEINNQFVGDVSINYRHFTPGKNNLFTMVKYSFNHEDADQYNKSASIAFSRPDYSDINQHVNPRSKTGSIEFTTQYGIPMDSFFNWSVDYSIRYNKDHNSQNVFDYDDRIKKYTLFNDSLTYQFNNSSTNQLIRVSLTYSKRRWFGSIGISYNLVYANNQNYATGMRYEYGLRFVAPNFILEYKAAPQKSLRLSVESNTIPVPLEQLMPVNNLKNPNYINVGNPDLLAGKSTNVSFNYMCGNRMGFNYSVIMMGSLQQNAITTSITTDSIGRQTSSPVNINGLYNIAIQGTIGGKIKDLSINYQVMLTQRNTSNLIDNQKNQNMQYGIRNNIIASYTHNRWDFSANGFIFYSASKYYIQNDQVYDFMMYNTSLSVSYEVGGYTIAPAVSYNSNSSSGQQFTVLNTSISKLFLKNKSLEVKAYIFDMLRQNQSIRTNQTASFIENISTNILPQYYMFSLAYFLGKKSPKANPLFF